MSKIWKICKNIVNWEKKTLETVIHVKKIFNFFSEFWIADGKQYLKFKNCEKNWKVSRLTRDVSRLKTNSSDVSCHFLLKESMSYKRTRQATYKSHHVIDMCAITCPITCRAIPRRNPTRHAIFCSPAIIHINTHQRAHDIIQKAWANYAFFFWSYYSLMKTKTAYRTSYGQTTNPC